MRKVKINDNQGQSVEVDIDEFKKHLDEFHSSGSSVHDEDGHYFTVDQNFRDKIKSLYCLLYTSPSPRDRSLSRMPSSA